MSAILTIKRDSRSYRQGLVLGLTMAETMLLLVFCLLMAAAMVFTRTLSELNAQKTANKQLSYENSLLELREAQRLHFLRAI
jgi:hypothetical protein